MYSDKNTSIPASILDLDSDCGSTFSKVISAIPAPRDFAGVHQVAFGCAQAVDSVVRNIGVPSPNLQGIHAELTNLKTLFATELNKSRTVELDDPMPMRKGKFPAWTAFTSLKNAPHSALLTAGAELLRIWGIEGKYITETVSSDIRQAVSAKSYSTSDLHRLINGGATTQNASWERRLRRSWRKVVRDFSAGLTPPSLSFEDRVRGQIRAAAKYVSPQRRAGAIDHRQLSPLQMNESLQQIADWITQDDFRGAAGYVVCSTGLSVDLAGQIPLLGSEVPAGWNVALDVDTGQLKTDFNAMASEAAHANLPGVIPSSFVLSKPMPCALAEHLRARMDRYPNAQFLADLYPGSVKPYTNAPVANLRCEITPSWARLRSSTGTYLRQLGMNNLLASLVSGDLGHVPNSKFYYAVVSAGEIHEACNRFYQTAGWGAPVASHSPSLHFGCRAVPTADHVRQSDIWLSENVQKSTPGKNCSVRRLLVHHNRFIALCGFRLSLLLALRERKELPLHANIDEARALWIGIHDKDVAGLNGPLPVPVSATCRATMESVRRHCRALRRRLEKHGERHSPLAQWCRDVESHQTVHLLMHTGLRLEVKPLGTTQFLKMLPQHLRLAPDFGRKILENHLRHAGLKSSDIDAVLRHAVTGQSPATSTSDFNLLSWIERVAPALDPIANQMLGEVVYGLSSE